MTDDLIIVEIGIYGQDGQGHTRRVVAMGIFHREAIEELIGWMVTHAPPLGQIPTREEAQKLLSGQRPVWVLLETPDAVWAAFFVKPNIIIPKTKTRRGKR